MYSIPIIQACISTIFIAATAAQIGTTNNPHCWQLPAGQYEGDTQCDLGWGNWYKCGGGAEVHHEASEGRIRLITPDRAATVQVFCNGQTYNFHCDQVSWYYDDWIIEDCRTHNVEFVRNLKI